MNDYLTLANLLFSHIDKTPDYYDGIYAPRPLADGAKVTRFAPSPTGFMHIGNMFVALIDRIAAEKGKGIFYLRIEDTDKKREVEGAIERILDGLSAFGIVPDEGVCVENDTICEKGNYAPYKQSERKEIYQCFAKSLVEKGLAYPCFCTEEELNSLREKQELAGVNPGYYGEWAACRNLSIDEQKAAIEAGKPYVLRLRSDGDENKKIFVDDQIKGKLEMPENIMDIVLLKTDGIPTYHFAHAVDDYLMRTTHVVRGDEWIASLPVHIQLFKALGVKPPKYAHVAPIMKLDEGNKRKLSKRKDPEASVNYYIEQAYPQKGVIEYLLTIVNSNYEEWRRANPDKSTSDFPFSFKKMSVSGALFDLMKLNDVCKNVISVMSADEVYDYTLEWAKIYDEKLYKLFIDNPEYAISILSIDRGGKKPRKDIAKWSDVMEYIEYFYEECFRQRFDVFANFSVKEDEIRAILNAYCEIYNENDTKDEWFDKIKSLCEPFGFTPNVKEYKANPENFKGHVGDISSFIRLAVTGRENSPDLYSIMQLLGRDEVLKRLSSI